MAVFEKRQMEPVRTSGSTQIPLFQVFSYHQADSNDLESRGSESNFRGSILDKPGVPCFCRLGRFRFWAAKWWSRSHRPGQWWQNEIRRSRTRSKFSIFILLTKRLSNVQYFQSKLDKQTFKIDVWAVISKCFSQMLDCSNRYLSIEAVQIPAY